MSYRAAELLLSVFLLAVSVIAWMAIRDIPADARMFPGAVLAVMAAGSVLMILRTLTGASQRALGEELDGWSFAIDPGRMIIGFALFAVYILIVNYLGFFTTSAIFVVVMAFFAEYRNWPRLIASALAFCIFVYAVFILLFDRPLPKELILTFLS